MQCMAGCTSSEARDGRRIDMEASNICAEDEMTIDIRHLLIMVAKKWRTLLALVLIGGLLGFGLQLIPKEDTTRTEKDTQLVEKTETAAYWREVCEKRRNYISNSDMMRVNANNLHIGIAKYYVYNCEDADYVMAEFNAVMQDENLQEQLCQTLGITTEKDLSYFAYVTVNKIIETPVKVPNKANLFVSANGEVPNKLDLSVSVAAETNERAKQALTIIQDALAQKAEQMSAAGKCTVEMMSKNLSVGISNRIKWAQVDELKNLNDAYDRYDKCVTLENKFNNKNSSKKPFVGGNPLKLPAILAVVALFIGCAWYGCAYIFSGRIMTRDDLQDFFRIRMLAFIDQKKPAKLALDRWLDRLELSGYPTSVTADYAAAMLEDGKPAVLYCQKDAVSEAIAKKMASRNANIVCMNFAGEDLDSLTNLKSGDCVVLLLRLNETKRVQLEQEVQVCAYKGVQIMGAILAR